MIIIDFITKHLINKIEDYTKHIKYDDIYYFNESIKSGNDIIDRANRFNVYRKGQNIPYSFYHLEKEALIEIFQKLKEGKITLKKNTFYSRW